MNAIIDIMHDNFSAAIMAILLTAIVVLLIKDIMDSDWFQKLADKIF